jgi:hypothetical protein
MRGCLKTEIFFYEAVTSGGGVPPTMQIPVTTSGRTHPYHPIVRPPFSLKSGAIVCFLTSALCLGQSSSIIVNNGEPLRASYACVDEDLQWAGVSCSEDEPCPVYLELSAIVPNGRRLFLAGNFHTNSATLSSVLLATEDGGATWKEPAARLRGAAIDQMEFYDLQHGWAAGETQYPLARDPFILISTDGGQGWRQQTVLEDGSPGTILRFSFDSPQHGELVIDAGKSSGNSRYLSYESQTGGDNWNLRGTSDKLPAAPRSAVSAADPDWRIQTSKDGKTWQVEKRNGDKWKMLSAFLVEAAVCKGDTRELTEPKEPDEPNAPVQTKADSKPDPKRKPRH